MNHRPALAADILAVDVGNSKLAAVRFHRGRRRGTYRIETRGLGDAALARSWRAVLADAQLAPHTPVVVSSVAPRTTRILVRATRAHRRRGPVHVVSWRDPWPFAIGVQRPERTGVDRLANLAGFCAAGGRDGIVVDAGTAVTIDVLRHGRFVGGLIAPGPALQLTALHAQTALLPAIAPTRTPALIGADTASAMRAGVRHVTREGVAQVARTLRARAGRHALVRTTGGWGRDVALALGDPGCFDPDLQIRGLRLLWARIADSE